MEQSTSISSKGQELDDFDAHSFPEKRAKWKSRGEVDDAVMTQALTLLRTVFFCFCTLMGEAFAVFRDPAKEAEAIPLRSEDFESRFTGLFLKTHDLTLNHRNFLIVRSVALCHARDVPPESVSCRVASIGVKENLVLVLDLCDRNGSMIEISASGSRLIKVGGVRFRRHPGMLALPMPTKPSRSVRSILSDLLRLPDYQIALSAGWILGAFNPALACPILLFLGPPGSAKSTKTRLIRRIVDPHFLPIRGLPEDLKTLMITAQNGWVLAIDNISTISKWASDFLCGLCTGSGFGFRKLYADSEESLFQICRPIILNGMSDFVTRRDLKDRTLRIELPPIPPHLRRTEAEIYAEFERSHPELLGAVVHCLSAALRNSAAAAPPPNLPRLADWFAFVAGAEEAMGFEPGTMARAIAAQNADIAAAAVEESWTVQVLLDWFIGRDEFEGTATGLLAELQMHAAGMIGGGPDVPRRGRMARSASKLSAELRDQVGNLAIEGIGVTFPRTGRTRTITLRRIAGEMEVGNDA